jgi:hypothetical protein
MMKHADADDDVEISEIRDGLQQITSLEAHGCAGFRGEAACEIEGCGAQIDARHLDVGIAHRYADGLLSRAAAGIQHTHRPRANSFPRSTESILRHSRHHPAYHSVRRVGIVGVKLCDLSRDLFVRHFAMRTLPR